MSNVNYEIVIVDGGYAYVIAGTYSEPFPTKEAVVSAADKAAKIALGGVSGEVEALERHRRERDETRH